MTEHDKFVETLREEYCPPIDEGLFEALRLDYDDLSQPGNLLQLRQALDQIKLDATIEEATGFDPTGTSSLLTHPDEGTPESSVRSAGVSSDLDIESLATGLSDLTWDDSLEHDPVVLSSWGGLSIDDKVRKLRGLMPQSNDTTVRFTLRKHHDKFDETVDELLTLAFLDEDEKRAVPAQRSLDEYASGAYRGSGRRKRNKRHDDHLSSAWSSPATSSESLPMKNVWTSSKEHIEFITSRTILSAEHVQSLYHAQGASLPRTISSIAIQHIPSSLDLDVQTITANLQLENPRIPQTTISGILVVTKNDLRAAQELIDAMVTAESSASIHPGKILPKYAPVDLGTEDKKSASSKSRTTNNATKSDPVSSLDQAGMNRIAGQQAFAKATAAYRRGKSDHLMGGAAAYYSEIGRGRVQAAREQVSAAADARAGLQSGANFIDLHGIGVMDAVRIASERTQAWWEELGDAKYASGGGNSGRPGYRVVTGVGRHSKDGAPRIGPAVTKRLLNEGWKVDIGQGELVVTGKRRMT